MLNRRFLRDDVGQPPGFSGNDECELFFRRRWYGTITLQKGIDTGDLVTRTFSGWPWVPSVGLLKQSQCEVRRTASSEACETRGLPSDGLLEEGSGCPSVTLSCVRVPTIFTTSSIWSFSAFVSSAGAAVPVMREKTQRTVRTSPFLNDR